MWLGETVTLAKPELAKIPAQKRQLRLAQATHRAEITVSGPCTAGEIKAVLTEWLASMNRCYLGRNWHRPDVEAKQSSAVLLDLRRPGDGSTVFRLKVKAPDTADTSDFAVRAPFLFGRCWKLGIPRLSASMARCRATMIFRPAGHGTAEIGETRTGT